MLAPNLSRAGAMGIPQRVSGEMGRPRLRRLVKQRCRSETIEIAHEGLTLSTERPPNRLKVCRPV